MPMSQSEYILERMMQTREDIGVTTVSISLKQTRDLLLSASLNRKLHRARGALLAGITLGHERVYDDRG